MTVVEAPPGGLEANAAAPEPGYRAEELLPSIETLPDLTLIVSSYEDLLPKDQDQVKALLLQIPNCEDTEAERLTPIQAYKAGNRASLLYLAREGGSIVGMFQASLRDRFGSLDSKDQGLGVISLSNAIVREDKRGQKVMTRLVKSAFTRLDEDIRNKFEIDAAVMGEEMLTADDREEEITLNMIREQLQHPALVVYTVEKTGDYNDKHGVSQHRIGPELRNMVVEAALDNGWVSDPTNNILRQMAGQKEVAEVDLNGTGNEVSVSFIFQFDNAEYKYPVTLKDGRTIYIPALRSGRIEYKYNPPNPEDIKNADEMKAHVASAVRAKYAELESAFQEVAGDELRHDDDEGFQAAYWVNKGDVAQTQGLKKLVGDNPHFEMDDSEPPQIRVHFQKLAPPAEVAEESTQ